MNTIIQLYITYTIKKICIYYVKTCVVRVEDELTVGEWEIIDKSMSIHCLQANCCLYSSDIFEIIFNKEILIHSEWNRTALETLEFNKLFWNLKFNKFFENQKFV